MKKIIVLLNLLILLGACKPENSDVFPTEVRLRINHYREQCTGVGQQTCYLVQQDKQIGSDQWDYFYDQIAGFDYEEGFICTLKVRIDKVANPPADASSLKYSLLEILSKEKVD